MTEVKKGIKNALEKIKHQNKLTQSNIVREVFTSEKFSQVQNNFCQTLEDKKRESENSAKEVLEDMDGLIKYVKLSRKEFKRGAEERKQNPQLAAQ